MQYRLEIISARSFPILYACATINNPHAPLLPLSMHNATTTD